MREIKFRAWDSGKKYMIHQSGAEAWFSDEENTLVFQMDNVVGDHDDGTRFKLMQYTGLKDKNGKEIYEGDIVEHKSKYKHVAGKFEVKYDNPSDFAGFCLHRVGQWEKDYPGDTGWEGILGSQGHLTKELEIIGNIYENPELIK